MYEKKLNLNKPRLKAITRYKFYFCLFVLGQEILKLGSKVISDLIEKQSKIDKIFLC